MKYIAMDRQQFTPHIPVFRFQISLIHSEKIRTGTFSICHRQRELSNVPGNAKCQTCVYYPVQRQIAITLFNALLNALHIALFNALENELAFGLR